MTRLADVFAFLAAISFAAEQPIPFSHKTHIDMAKLACQDCHPAPEKFGASMGFPAASRCMACHVLIAKDKPLHLYSVEPLEPRAGPADARGISAP